jgi:hypothetical protein
VRAKSARQIAICSTLLLPLALQQGMSEADAPPLLAAQALLLSERGRDLIVFNPGAPHQCAATCRRLLR